jgi:phage terminase large subunit-like protein
MNAEVFKLCATDPAVFRANLKIDVDGRLEPFRPADWQDRDFRALDSGWLRCAGRPAEGGASRAYLERPRGASKTSDLAIQSLWCLAFSPNPIRGYAAAADRDQAQILADVMGRLVQANSWLAELLDCQRLLVRNRRTGAELSIISSDAPTSYGLLADFIVIDELTHWKSDALWISLLSTSAKRKDCLLLVISNAGTGMGTSWQWGIRENARTSPGWHFSRLERPPAWIGEDRLAEQRRLLPRNAYQRLWENLWTSASGDAIDEEDLRAAIKREDAPGWEITGWASWAGLDLSLVRDRSALVVVGIGARRRLELLLVKSWKPLSGRSVDLALVEQYVLEANQRFGFRHLTADIYQAAQMVQSLCRNGVRAEALSITASIKEVMASTIIEVFRDGTLDLYNHRELIDDLSRLQLLEKGTHFSLEAARTADGHADTAFALALALLARQKSPAVGPSVYATEEQLAELEEARINRPRESAAAAHGLYTGAGVHPSNALRRGLYGCSGNPYRSRWVLRD